MDATVIASGILAALQLVEALLPQLGVAGSAVSIVDTVINMLTKLLPAIEQVAPLIGGEVQLIYRGVKNIIANLRGTDTTAEQDAALDAFDAQVDAAWNINQDKFDPDFVPSSTAT